MLPIANAIEEIAGLDPQSLSDELLTRTQPAVFRGLVSSWPVARAGRESAAATDAYLRRFYKDATVNAMLGAPDIGGRFFYSDDLTGFNFKPVRIRLDAVLDEIARQSKSEIPPAIYVGSTTVDTCLPGFRAENDLALGESPAAREHLAGQSHAHRRPSRSAG